MVKSNGSAKYVELSVEDLWTRVRFPPPPPKLRSHPCGGFLILIAVGGNRSRGTRGEPGIRAACGEPVSDNSLASELAGQDGRFPPPPPPKRKAVEISTALSFLTAISGLMSQLERILFLSSIVTLFFAHCRIQNQKQGRLRRVDADTYSPVKMHVVEDQRL